MAECRARPVHLSFHTESRAVPNVNTLLRDHVTLKCEMVDRIFLNGYVAKLQEPDQLFWFLCQQRGEEIPRYELLGKMTRDFVTAVDAYAADRQIPVVHFEKGQRKEDVARPYFQRAEREGRHGVVMIGISQERANVFRPPAKGQRQVGKFAAHRNSAYVKYVYFYVRDHDFGPVFIRFCTYAPSVSGSASTATSGCSSACAWLVTWSSRSTMAPPGWTTTRRCAGSAAALGPSTSSASSTAG